MAKKGFLATLFGGGGKRSGGSRTSKGRSTSSCSKARSSASKTTSRAKRQTKTPSNVSTTKNKKGLMARFFDWLSGLFTKKKKSDVGKIYKTTDGYFTQNPAITKKRRVAVIDQRDSDGALAVTKIYSKYDENGKERKGKAYIDDLTLSPKKHSSLNHESIVGTQVHIGTKKAGVKTPAEKNFQPIIKRELEPTKDRLTKAELKKVQDSVHNDTPGHRATHERTMEKWHSGFKKNE